MNKTIELTEQEINILTACVKAAAEEGFYSFSEYDVGEVSTESMKLLLGKLGVDTNSGYWENIL